MLALWLTSRYAIAAGVFRPVDRLGPPTLSCLLQPQANLNLSMEKKRMAGMFVSGNDVAREQLSWGSLAWCCRPAGMGMKNLVVIEVTLAPGGGHAFHRHPRQEEVIYCVEGEVEQWLEEKKQSLRPGDAVVIPAGCVHASFNRSARDAKLLAILGPSVNDQSGYEVTEVADQPPWNTLAKVGASVRRNLLLRAAGRVERSNPCEPEVID